MYDSNNEKVYFVGYVKHCTKMIVCKKAFRKICDIYYEVMLSLIKITTSTKFTGFSKHFPPIYAVDVISRCFRTLQKKIEIKHPPNDRATKRDLWNLEILQCRDLLSSHITYNKSAYVFHNITIPFKRTGNIIILL